MKEPRRTPESKPPVDRDIIGRDRFGKISAVEGIVLTAAMKRRAAAFDRQGLSAEQRRREIIQIYRER